MSAPGRAVRLVAIYAQWCVMRAPRAGVTVLLDGQGADEIFGGYPGSTDGRCARWPLAALRGLVVGP